MRRVLDTLSDLEEAGIYNSQTGEITIPKAAKPSKPTGNDDGEDFVLAMEHLPPELQDQAKALKRLQQDMGSLMGYITRNEIRDRFEFSEEEIEMQLKLAALDPSKSPMEHAVLYDERKKEWGQKAVDAYVEALKQPKQEGHERKTSDEPAIEIFGEKPVFSFNPAEHDEGANVVNPSLAANKYLEAVFEGKTGE